MVDLFVLITSIMHNTLKCQFVGQSRETWGLNDSKKATVTTLQEALSAEVASCPCKIDPPGATNVSLALDLLHCAKQCSKMRFIGHLQAQEKVTAQGQAASLEGQLTTSKAASDLDEAKERILELLNELKNRNNEANRLEDAHALDVLLKENLQNEGNGNFIQ
ncbi:hypothetical protein ABBQ38_013414 [Trebouxia sp. C0009 RCD-2024]